MAKFIGYGNFKQDVFEIGLVKSDLQQSSRPKVSFIEDFWNTFDFTFSVFQAVFNRLVKNKRKVLQVIFTLYFLPYLIVSYYT